MYKVAIRISCNSPENTETGTACVYLDNIDKMCIIIIIIIIIIMQHKPQTKTSCSCGQS